MPFTRRLFLKGSTVLADLGAIVPEEVPFMQIGEYPAVEALSFAIAELADDARGQPPKEQRRNRPVIMHRLGF